MLPILITPDSSFEFGVFFACLNDVFNQYRRSLAAKPHDYSGYIMDRNIDIIC